MSGSTILSKTIVDDLRALDARVGRTRKTSDDKLAAAMALHRVLTGLILMLERWGSPEAERIVAYAEAFPLPAQGGAR